MPEFPQEPVHPYLRNAAILESSVEDVLREQADYKAWADTAYYEYITVRFEAQFPDWQAPTVEQLTPFRDSGRRSD